MVGPREAAEAPSPAGGEDAGPPVWERVTFAAADAGAVAGAAGAGAGAAAAGGLGLERAGHSATVFGKFIYVLGGRKGSKFYKDLLRFDTETHTWARVLSRLPCRERANHTATLVGRECWFIGGCDNERVLPDVHVLNLETHDWRTPEIRDDQRLLMRTAHAAEVHPNDPRAILIFGGWGPGGAAAFGSCNNGDEAEAGAGAGAGVGSGSGSGAGADVYAFLNDLVVLHTDTRVAKRVSVMGALRPAPRGYHSMTVVGTRAYVFGGRCPAACASGGAAAAAAAARAGEVRGADEPVLVDGAQALCVYDAALNEWSLPQPSGAPPAPRSSHRAALVGDRIVLHGGAGAAAGGAGAAGAAPARMDDVHALVVGATPDRLHWSTCDQPAAGGPVPSGRSAHSLSLVGASGRHRLYVLFGYSGDARRGGRKYAADWCYRLTVAPDYRSARARRALRSPSPAPAPAQAPAKRGRAAAAGADQDAAATEAASGWHEAKRTRTGAQQRQQQAEARQRQAEQRRPAAEDAAALALAAAAAPTPLARRAAAGAGAGTAAVAAMQATVVTAAAVAVSEDSAPGPVPAHAGGRRPRALAPAGDAGAGGAGSPRGGELQPLEAQLRHEKRAGAQALAEQAALAAQLQRELERERALREDAERQWGASRGANTQLRCELDALRARQQGDEAERQRRFVEAERLRTRVGDLSQRVEALAQQLSDARQSARLAGADADTWRAQLDAAREAQRAAEAEMARAQAAHAAAALQLREQAAAHEAQARQAEEREQRLRLSVQEQSEQLHAQRGQLADALRARDGELAEARRRAELAAEQARECEARAEARQNELAATRCQLQQTRSDLQSVNARNNQLEADKARADAELDAERRERHALQHERDELARLQRAREAAMVDSASVFRRFAEIDGAARRLLRLADGAEAGGGA